MNYNRNKILKMAAILALICVVVSILTRVNRSQSLTLEDYANQNPEIAYKESESEDTDSSKNESGEEGGTPAPDTSLEDTASPIEPEPSAVPLSSLVGASLNNAIPEEQRTLYTDGFYHEPLSENLQRYITGISYPAVQADSQASTETTDPQTSAVQADSVTDPVITYDDLRYVHIWHYDFNGDPAEGELICNQAIAQDLLEIFYELYRNEYQIEKVRLIDEYDGDDTASMEDNNTSCFNYRVVEGSTSLSKHAYGLAIDINPLYNPYITYNKDGTENVSPVSAQPYADRNSSFPYKINEEDLCYRLFKEHGFTWGGSWNSSKDYQHFQKAIK